jgi:hypothetical protein
MINIGNVALNLSFDVFVGGGGVAGVCAAVAAARGGARTLLVERNGFLGGAATAGAVNQFIGWKTAGGRQIVAGIAQEIIDRLKAKGGGTDIEWWHMSTGLRMDRIEFDPEVLKVVLDEFVLDAGVTPLFNSWLFDVERQGRVITKVRLLSKSGEIEVTPRVVIDTSGDLDLLDKSGCEMLALEPGEELQPATLSLRMGPIDFQAYNAISPLEKAEIARRGVAEGGLARLAVHCNQVPGTNEGWFNVTRIVVDGTDAFALSRAEVEGRRQALAAAKFLCENLPGCEKARLTGLAPSIGIRETRRIRGAVVVTEADLRSGRRFSDTVACGAYPIDVHQAGGAGIRLERVGEGDHSYTLPLRALIPVALDNALVAGRGVSATHVAFSALRVMPVSMAMGQAAGVAAANAIRRNAAISDLPFDSIERDLLRGGAILR